MSKTGIWCLKLQNQHKVVFFPFYFIPQHSLNLTKYRKKFPRKFQEIGKNISLTNKIENILPKSWETALFFYVSKNLVSDIFVTFLPFFVLLKDCSNNEWSRCRLLFVMSLCNSEKTNNKFKQYTPNSCFLYLVQLQKIPQK